MAGDSVQTSCKECTMHVWHMSRTGPMSQCSAAASKQFITYYYFAEIRIVKADTLARYAYKCEGLNGLLLTCLGFQTSTMCLHAISRGCCWQTPCCLAVTDLMTDVWSVQSWILFMLHEVRCVVIAVQKLVTLQESREHHCHLRMQPRRSSWLQPDIKPGSCRVCGNTTLHIVLTYSKRHQQIAMDPQQTLLATVLLWQHTAANFTACS